MKPATPENIDLELITVAEGRRPVDADAVARLAKSIGEIGLRTPITVLSVNEGERLDLVAGAHRFAAVKSLAWQTVPCFVIEGDALDAEMWEIAENLLRVDLSKEQRDRQIRRYADLLAEKENRVVHSAPPEIGFKKPPPAKKGVAQKVAEQTGLSKSTVRRALFQPDPEKIAADAARKEHDKLIEVGAADAFASWLMSNMDLDQLPQIIAWLEGTKPRQVIDALHRLASDVPVFDRSAA